MQFIEIVLAVLAVIVVLILALVVRRRILLRAAGAVDMALRIRVGKAGGGWALGVGRYAGDQLEWFRALSLMPRPSRMLSRSAIAVERQRDPDSVETWGVQPRAAVLECSVDGTLVQLALTPDAIPGFLSWLESSPPGSAQTHRARPRPV